MRCYLSAMICACFAAPCTAQSMPLSDFLPRAEALQKKGMMAILSSDLKPVMAEANAAFTAYRQQLEAERAAGHPSSCPLKGKAAVTSDELLKSFKAIPVADRPHTTTQQGVAHLMALKYPCAH